MANQSIYSAFERFWSHVVARLNNFVLTENFDSHIDDISNPHKTTKDQIGLGNVDNTADSAKSVNYANTAGSAVSATQDGSGNIIVSTYETKTESQTKLGEAKSYTDTKTSGLASTSSVNTNINTHNTSTSAHNDIRELISDLSIAVNNFLDVDDTTTDQLSEVLTLINNNKGTLESLTTSKVNVSDIIDNLTTASTSKVLSANQGIAIKALIDALEAELDSHTHTISDVSGLQSALDGKAESSHGDHVNYSADAPNMDGVASAGSSDTVARTDHIHPTDTSRASKTELEELAIIVSGKANVEDIPEQIIISEEEPSSPEIDDLWIDLLDNENINYIIRPESANLDDVLTYKDGDWIPFPPVMPDISGKMEKSDPVGAGSFSLNRKQSSNIGNFSSAFGYNSESTASCSFASGDHVVASGIASHVYGRYNISDDLVESPNGSYAQIIGNGTSEDDRSNAHTVTWDGEAWFGGDVYVGSASGKQKDEGSKKLAVLSEVEDLINDSISQLSGESSANIEELRQTVAAQGENLETLINESTQGLLGATEYTGTLLSSGWSADSNGYQSQTITILGLKSSYPVSPDFDVVLSGSDQAGDQDIMEGFHLIGIATTAQDSLTVKSLSDAPTVNIPIRIRVWEE